MENLSMCRICLATDVRMCAIASHLRDMYERITSVTFKRKDMRPLVTCYICHARLRSCYRLRTSCLQSEELLTEMMSSSELKPQDVLSTNTLSIVPVLQLSVGHALQDTTECHVKEEDSEFIHDAELDQHNTEDIQIELQEESDVQLDDNNQCSHLDDPIDVIKSEPDDVDTGEKEKKRKIVDTILEENNPNDAGLCSQLAENICTKTVEIVLQRIDVNVTATDIQIEPQEEYDVQLHDNNQCSHLEDPIDVIKSESDDVDTEEEIDVISLDTQQPLPTTQTHVHDASVPRVPLAQERRHVQHSVETARTRRSLRLVARTPAPVPAPNIANASRRRTRGPDRRGRRSNTVIDSEAESPEIERRSNHNDMERFRRFGLKNLFHELKQQIPATRDKERAAKIVILREAAALCRKFSHEDIQREQLRKKQSQLVAKLNKLRRHPPSLVLITKL